tara:strand:- start:290 stop:535 length:246 start_codon:yes stop_codon:yes gene_type:complete
MNINLETISSEAYKALHALDKTYIGTEDYMGIAWYHAHEFRHYMRDTTIAKRRNIHKILLSLDLPLNGDSDEHAEIIEANS